MPGPSGTLAFLLLALLAEIAGTVGGFGSSVFFVPAAALFFDFESVLGITALFHLVSNASKLGLFRAGVEWRIVLWMGVPSVALAALGGLASAWVPVRALETALGAALVLVAAWMWWQPTWMLRPGRLGLAAGGAVSGGLAGLVGTGGAVRGAALAAFDLRKEVFVATSAAIDLGTDLARAGAYLRNGYIHGHDLAWLPLLAVVAWLGTWIGRRVLRRVPQARFRRIALAMVGGIGAWTLVAALRG
ncbi:sulfite exporter TauE/SafE family protein [Tolypothrix campylonemoides VB511288]|nr:sulfite exporter TauE/SafE family protein [Tolypothrix campylonemoides VB511288]